MGVPFPNDSKNWFGWKGNTWVAQVSAIEKDTLVGTGTRNLTADGKKAIGDPFNDSFGPT